VHRPQLESLEGRLAPATAITDTWTGLGANTNWNNTANWSTPNAGGLPQNGDDLVFPGGVTTSLSLANNLTTASSFNSLTFSGSGYTLKGSQITLANTVSLNAQFATDTIALPIQLAGAAGALQFFTVNTGSTLTLSGSLKGTTGSTLTKEGPGTLILSADNSGFTGSFTVDASAGVLQVQNSKALGANTGNTPGGQTTTVEAGAQLQLSSASGITVSPNVKLILNGKGIATDGGLLNVAGNNTWAGTIQLASDAFIGAATTGTPAVPTVLTVTGQVSDQSLQNLTKVGGGTLVFAAANAYHGTTEIVNGILQLQDPGGLQNSAGTIVDFNTTTQNFGTLQLDDESTTGFTVPSEPLTLNGSGSGGIGALDNLKGQNTWLGNITLATDSSIGVDTASALTVQGVVSGARALTKIGPGTLLFPTANTYSAGTNVAAGILEIEDSQGLGTGPATVSTSATLELAVDTNTDSVTTTTNTLYVTNSLSLSGTGTAGQGALFSASGINVYAGSISLAGSEDGIGVASDPNPTNGPGYFPTYSTASPYTASAPGAKTGDFSLTIPGGLGSTNNQLDKEGGGQLILTGPSKQYTGNVDIQQGWITIQNNDSLGGLLGGTSQNGQATVTVEDDASLHLKPKAGNSLTLHQNFVIHGVGITHPFVSSATQQGISQEGAILSLEGVNTINGNVVFAGPAGGAGIGAQLLDPSQFPAGQLYLTGPVSQSPAGSGLVKLGSQLVVLQGDGTYTGGVTVQEGVLLNQNTTGLGGGGTVTVAAGATLALANGTRFNNANIEAGYQVRGLGLVLNGPGNNTLLVPGSNNPVAAGPLAPLVVLSNDNLIDGDPSLAQRPAFDNIIPSDFQWNGNVSLNASAALDVEASARLNIAGTIDDAGNTGGASDLIKIDTGELVLSGSNTYRGFTYVGTSATSGAPGFDPDQVNEFFNSTNPQALAGGVLTVANSQALGASNHGGVVVQNGSSLQLQGTLSISKSLTVAGAGVPSVGSTANWLSQGPAPIANGQTLGAAAPVSGRVTGIAVDPMDPTHQTIYLATAGGGAWKTVNGGQSWLPLFDGNGTVLFTGAIAVTDTGGQNPIIYLGTGEADNSIDSFAGTGVYRSADGGHTWQLLQGPTTETGGANPLNGLAVSQIIVDPFNPNMIFVATSDQVFNGQTAPPKAPLGNPVGTSDNVGVWRFDGKSWFNLTAFISPIRMSGTPANSNLTAASAGPPKTAGPDDNFLLSFPQQTATWSGIQLAGSGPTAVLFASLGTATGRTVTTYGIENGVNFANQPVNSVYFTLGAESTTPTWFIGDGKTDGETATIDFPLTTSAGNIKISAVGPDTQNQQTTFEDLTIYAAVTSSTTGALQGVFKGAVVGGSGTFFGNRKDEVKWAAVTPSKVPAQTLGNYASSILATSASTVYFADQNDVQVTTNGGGSWTDITRDANGNAPAADVHALALDGTNILAGSDGGVWSLNPSSSNAWTDINGNLAIALLPSISPANSSLPTAFVAGSPPSGVVAVNNSLSGSMAFDNSGASPFAGQVRVDPTNPNILFAWLSASVIGNPPGGATATLFASADGGKTWSSTSVAANTQNPALVIDGAFTSGVRVLAGGHTAGGADGLLESLGGAAGPWVALFQGTVSALAAATLQGPFQPDLTDFADVKDLGASTDNPSTLYVTDGTRLFVTEDHGTKWVDRTASLPSGVLISDIEVDPRNSYTVYVVSGTASGTGLGRVFLSTDAGQHWTDISSGATPVPDIPVWKLVIDPRTGTLDPQTGLVQPGTGTLYLGTDQGVYVTQNGGNSWQVLDSSLPTAQVRDLALNQTLNTLTIATYGRSAYTFFLNTSQANALAGALTVLSGSAVWTGPVNLYGPTTIGADGSQALQNGVASAELNIQGVISDVAGTSNNALTIGGAAIDGGTITFSGQNTYTGATEVKPGSVLVVNNPQALGSSTNGTVVDAGAALEIQTSLNGEPVTLNGDGAFQVNGHWTGALHSLSGTNTYTGTLTLNTPEVTIGVDSGSTLTVGDGKGNGTVTDGGAGHSLVKELGGTLAFAGANSYGSGSGTFSTSTDVQGGNPVLFANGTVVAQGILNIQNGSALAGTTPAAVTTTTVLNGAQVQIQGGITVPKEKLRIAGNGVLTAGVNTGALENVSGANTWAGPITLADLAADQSFGSASTNPAPPASVMIGALSTGPADTADTLTVTGTIGESGAAGGPVGLTKVGSGLVVLDDTNSYTGPTLVSAGTLRLQTSGALPAAASNTVAAGAALQVDGDPTGLGGTTGLTISTAPLVLNGTGLATVNAGALENFSGVNTWTSPILLQTIAGSGQTDAIGVDAGTSLTVTGIIRDPGPLGSAVVPVAGLMKVGAGTLVLPNPNTYTGLTTVAAGILNVPSGTTIVGGVTESPLGALVSEVQTVTLSGPQTGSFTLQFTNPNTGVTSTTDSLSANPTVTTAIALQNALTDPVNFPAIGPGNVVVSLTGSTYTIRFQNGLAGQFFQPFVSTGANGTGVAVAITVDGSQGTAVTPGGTLQIQGGITLSSEPLTIAGNGFNGTGALDSSSGNNLWDAPITLAGNGSIAADTDSTSTQSTLTVDQAISESAAGSSLTKLGTGIVVFTGTAPNTYTGATLVNDGTLQLAKPSGVAAVPGSLTVGDGNVPGPDVVQLEADNQLAGSSAVTVNSDGVLDLNGHQQTIGSLTMTGGKVTLESGSLLTLGGDVTATSDSGGNPATVGGAGTLSLGPAGRTFTVKAGGGVPDMTISALITGTGDSLTKAGNGTLQLTNTEAYTGGTTVKAGTLLVDGAQGQIGAVTVAGGTIGGTGTVGAITELNSLTGGTVAPGDSSSTGQTPGILNTAANAAVAFNGKTTFSVALGGNTPGNGPGNYGQLSASGIVTLGSATLTGSVANGFSPAINSTYTIIQTTGSITGQFAGIAPGGAVFLSGEKFTVTYNPSSVVLTHVALSTTTAVAVSPVSGVPDTLYAVTATVTPENPAGIPRGSVNISVKDPSGHTTTTSVPLNGTSAVLQLQGLAVGTYTVTNTTYVSSDTNSFFGSSATTTPSFTVSQDGSTTSAVSLVAPNNTNPSTFGQPLTFQVTVSPKTAGGPVATLVPTGNVTFKDNGVALANGTVALVAGVATLTIPSSSPALAALAVGSHTITASYAGDANYSGSTSSGSGLGVTVNQASTTVTVASSVPGTAAFGAAAITATVAPTSGSGTPTGSVTFQVTGTNAFTETDSLSGGSAALQQVLTPGSYTITATYSGDGNFLASNQSNSINQTVTRATPTVKVTSSAANNTSVSGQPVTLTAAVSTTSGIPAPTGTVTFFIDGVQQVPDANLSGGKATLQISTLGVSATPHTVSVTYNSDGNYTSASGSLTGGQTVNQAATKTQLVSSAANNTSLVGQPVTFTATVTVPSPGSGTAHGSVRFFDNGTQIGTAQTLATVSGQQQASVTVTYSAISLSGHPITAVYQGDDPSGDFAGSTSNTVTQVVNPVSTGTTVVSSSTNNTSTFGDKVTFTATVKDTTPGTTGTPTGTVIFYVDSIDAGHVLGQNTLNQANPDTTSITTSPLQLMGGGHTIFAVYQGDGNFGTSQGTVSQTVNKAGTTTSSVTSDNASPVFGQTIHLSATVTAPFGVPTGTVTFLDQGNPIGSGPVNTSTSTATVTVPVSGLAFGSHSLTAQYSSDGNFQGSGSPSAFSQSVAAASTSTTASSTNQSAAYGEPVITATVSNTSPGSTAKPAGKVVFAVNNGSTTVTETDTLLSDGTAKLQMVLAPGSYTITATYNEDSNPANNNSNFTGSSGTLAGGQVINKAQSSVSLPPLSSPPVTGQAVVLTATVTDASPGSGVPTGFVQFFDGASQIGTNQTLTTVSGQQQASVTWTPLTATTHALTAKYLSDGNFQNNQASLSQQVTPDGTVTQISVSPPHPVVGDSATIQATISAAFPGGGTPTGSVTFTVDGQQTTLGLTGGQASLTVSGLAQGSHTVAVAYIGVDPNYKTSSSALTLSVLTRNQGFIAQLYRDLLGREAALSEILGWSNLLDQHDQNPFTGLSRTQVANLFVTTVEFLGDEVDALYVKYLHRHADPAGQAGWIQFLQAGNTVEQLAAQLAGSVEFFNLEGGTNTGFLNGLYTTALNRPVDQSGLITWLPLLNAGVQRSQVGFGIINSAEALGIVVTGFYQKYLHRTPDPTGLSGWVSAIARGPLHAGLTDEQVIAAFIGSDEYFNDL
jgi:autotransporter-associated beta strand protein